MLNKILKLDLQNNQVGFSGELQKQLAKSQVVERLGFLSHKL